jgi:DNA-binding response OmpR family regulator
VSEGVETYSLVSDDGRIALRVRLRLQGVQASEEHLGESGAVADWSRGRISKGENRVRLSRTELRLFAALVDRNGATATRSELAEELWPNRADRREKEHGLPVYICALRKRLARVGLGSALQTVRGAGYRLAF